MSNLALVQTWTEEIIAEASPANNNNLFSELVDSYSKDLQRYAHWLTGDKHTAEDLVQETLLRAWKSLHRLQNPKAAKGWLFTILRRENARRFERKQLQESDIPLETLESRDNYYDTGVGTRLFRARNKLKEALVA